MIPCQTCGFENEVGSAFCIQCGHDFTASPPPVSADVEATENLENEEHAKDVFTEVGSEELSALDTTNDVSSEAFDALETQLTQDPLNLELGEAPSSAHDEAVNEGSVGSEDGAQVVGTGEVMSAPSMGVEGTKPDGSATDRASDPNSAVQGQPDGGAETNACHEEASIEHAEENTAADDGAVRILRQTTALMHRTLRMRVQ